MASPEWPTRIEREWDSWATSARGDVTLASSESVSARGPLAQHHSRQGAAIQGQQSPLPPVPFGPVEDWHQQGEN